MARRRALENGNRSSPIHPLMVRERGYPEPCVPPDLRAHVPHVRAFTIRERSYKLLFTRPKLPLTCWPAALRARYGGSWRSLRYV